MTYRAIDAKSVDARGLKFESDAGKKPELKWIPISKLVIDPAYQRQILERGKRNVRKIATEFRWTRFEPVVVAPVAGGRYAIINGQHRATGAAMRGIKEIPCAVVDADKAEQAAAFAAINGDVTAVTSLQLFYAALAANQRGAKALQTVCAQAKVTICRYPVPATEMKVGETLAIGALERCLSIYGDVVLGFALQCITGTGGGNPGLVRAQIVRALCAAIKGNPLTLRSRTKVIAAIEDYKLVELWDEARKLAITEKRSIVDLLTQAFTGIFVEAVGRAKAA